MNPSNKDHNNWLTVGEVIKLIKKPVASYTSHIIEKLHERLCKDCLPLGRCPNPGRCQTKNNPVHLCLSCIGWYKELAKSHQNKNERLIKWHDNCDTSKWPVDSWEVAKFFMPLLGDNKKTTKDANSTDLSSLLNVLAWMKNVVFDPDRRVNLDLVRKLRSEVRNPWAHAPNQELTDADLNEAFDIANKFVVDLDEVFSCVEVKKCIEDIKFLQANGISSVPEAELKTLKLLRDELCTDVSESKGKIKRLEVDQFSDRQDIEEHQRRLENLDNCRKQCLTRMEVFSLKTEKNIAENRADIKALQDTVNVQETDGRFRLKSSIPDKPPTIIGRGTEVQSIISSLVEDSCGIVSIVGGPGFGKSTIAREVSHLLSNNHDIIVIFSFMSNASTLPEVILRLCRVVGVNPGKDPESSLMFWLKNIEKKVVLVMDNIEQLLEKELISDFTKLVVTLRTNSQQQLQILTTTRTAFSNLDRTTKNIPMGELDEKSSIELLKTYCPKEEVKYEYLSELARLCGFVPLALCIAGSRIPDLDDPFELIQWLKEMPMKALQTSDKSQSVRKAIEFSFQMLSGEDQKALIRLSVFNGNFQKRSAGDIIGRDGLDTQDFLQKLVARSLIQTSSDKRFVIHSLIRRFLSDHDQLQDEKAPARRLMVNHFLKLCHSLTIESYSKDSYSIARQKFKKDAHNVEETFKICSQDQVTNPNSNIMESLESSDIYNSSSRFFYYFVSDLLPETVLRNFYISCVKLAKIRKQAAIETTFQCLVADQEGRKSAWNSPEYFEAMKAIKEALDSNNAMLKKDRSLFSYCYYFYGRYYSNEATNTTPWPDLPEDELAPLSGNKARSPTESAHEVFIAIRRGELNKIRATKVCDSDKEKYMGYANLFYNQALSTAKESLGDHESTCTCHKLLGDLYFARKNHEQALTHYCDAIKLRRKLQLESNDPVVYLLKNYGLCLCYLRRFQESVETLEEARVIAEKLAEMRPCTAEVYHALARTFRDWKPGSQAAAKYADLTKEVKDLLDPRYVDNDIFKTTEENVERQNAQKH